MEGRGEEGEERGRGGGDKVVREEGGEEVGEGVRKKNIQTVYSPPYTSTSATFPHSLVF